MASHVRTNKSYQQHAVLLDVCAWLPRNFHILLLKFKSCLHSQQPAIFIIVGLKGQIEFEVFCEVVLLILYIIIWC